MRIYGDHVSGNSYKIELLCHQLGIGYEWAQIGLF